jgi:hypothetical protein
MLNDELHYLTFYGTCFLRVSSNLSDDFQFYCDQNGSTEALGKRLFAIFLRIICKHLKINHIFVIVSGNPPFLNDNS